MALPFAQADYGVFDTKFLGVCLRFHADAPDAFETFVALTSGKKAHPESALTSVHELAVASVLDHEFRHLHDFVLSPHGNKIFRLRLAAIFHGMQAVRSGLPVPTPLVAWSRMTPRERRLQEQLWNQKVLSPKRSDMPLLSEAAKNYAQVRQCLVATTELQPVDLYEASAVLVQVYAIERIAGEELAIRFLRELLGGAVPARYARVLAMLHAFWGRLGRRADLNEFAAVISWSMLGTFGKQPGDDPPTRRFLELLNLFKREGAPNFSRPLANLYAEWDATLGYTPVVEAMRENQAANAGLAAAFDQLPPNHGDTLFCAVANSCRLGIRALSAANEAMAALYLASPESYVYPDVYVDNGATIKAPVRFDFINMGYRSSVLHNLGFEIDVEIPDPSGNIALSASLHPTGPNAINGQVASTVAMQIMLCDYLLSDLSRHDMDFRLARQKLREGGIKTLEIL